MDRELADFREVEVFSFHQLCEDVATAAGVALLPRSSAEYFDSLPLALLDAVTNGSAPGYDALIVDEAQDFDPVWWDCILGCVEDPQSAFIYSFRDDNQLLYGTSAPLPGADTFPLDTNRRNTRQIHALARDLYKGSFYEASDASGLAPDFRETTGGGLSHDLESTLAYLLNEGGFHPSQIVVLTCAGRDSSRVPLARLVQRTYVGSAPVGARTWR